MGVFKKYKDKYSGSHFNRLRRNRLHNGQINYVSNPFGQFNNMAMKLTDREKGILDGQQGEAARMALSSLVDLGELFGAEEMISEKKLPGGNPMQSFLPIPSSELEPSATEI